MYKIRKTAEAEQDLIDIWFYTLQEWGTTQADKYVDELETGIARLEDNSKLGKSRDELRDGYRSIHINSHTIYYIIQSPLIRIIRILHDSMDPDRYL